MRFDRDESNLIKERDEPSGVITRDIRNSVLVFYDIVLSVMDLKIIYEFLRNRVLEDIGKNVCIRYRCPYLMVIAQSSDDLTNNSHDSLILSRKNHVASAVTRLHLSQYFGEILKPSFPVAMAKAPCNR